MEKFLKILEEAIKLEASDIHMINGKPPILRIERRLVELSTIDTLTKYDLEGLMEYLVDDSLELGEYRRAQWLR